MRSTAPEEYITGDKPDRERFQKFAESLEMAIGNPMYTWCHLELKKYFGYEGVLNGETAEEVWNLCNEAAERPEIDRPRPDRAEQRCHGRHHRRPH